MGHPLSLKDTTVLVTGATGCLGGRLVERLIQVEGARVRALVRNWAHAVRIARLPVELVTGDLLDPAALASAAAGCALVLHCAYGSDGDPAHQRQVTVEGTANLLGAARQAGVARFVHVSTIAVHGLDAGEGVEETAPYRCAPEDIYSSSKIAAEQLTLAYHREHGLAVTVVRPGDVYGPYSIPWTIGPVDSLRRGTLQLIAGEEGTICPIYVDDVVEGLVRAAVHPQAVGEVFMLVGEPVPWWAFFRFYQDLLGGAAIVELPRAAWQDQWRRQAFARTPLGSTLAYAGSPRTYEVLGKVFLLGHLFRLAGKAVPRALKRAILGPAEALYRAKRWPQWLPGPLTVQLYATRRSYSGGKAERVLGFRPRYSLEEGMRKTADWLAYAGYV